MSTAARLPLWLRLVAVVALELVARALVARFTGDAGADDQARELLAFWAFIGLIASAIWKGIEVAGRVTLEVLKWSVMQLWAFARTVYNATLAVGKELLRGLRKSWDFLKATYEHVLKPGWEKFWKWFDRARKWLEDIFRPVFKFLETLQTWVRDFYDKWVRPILDSIGIARKVLRVLQSLGLDWAKRLDGRLAELERRIDAPFRAVLSKLNEVIGIVNRIVTADGLFQRLTLIRSIERDIRQVSRAFVNWRSKPLTEADFEQLRQQARAKTYEQVTTNAAALLGNDSGPYKPWVDEMTAVAARILTSG